MLKTQRSVLKAKVIVVATQAIEINTKKKVLWFQLGCQPTTQSSVVSNSSNWSLQSMLNHKGFFQCKSKWNMLTGRRSTRQGTSNLGRTQNPRIQQRSHQLTPQSYSLMQWHGRRNFWWQSRATCSMPLRKTQAVADQYRNRKPLTTYSTISLSLRPRRPRPNCWALHRLILRQSFNRLTAVYASSKWWRAKSDQTVEAPATIAVVLAVMATLKRGATRDLQAAR